MIYKKIIFVVFFFISGISFSQNNALISVNELKDLKNTEQSFTIIDLRKPKDFSLGHIKGAINLWRSNIVDSNYVFGGMRISRDTLQSLFSKIGVNTNDRIVIYDAKGDVDAARLWWMLYNYGHKKVWLLNGGLTEWELQNNSLTTDITLKEKSNFEFFEQENNNLIISFEDLKKAVIDSMVTIIDTRTLDEYIGVTQKKGAYRKGRIPRSIFIDWAANIDYNGNRKFKSIEVLSDLYSFLGENKNTPIVTYCQSGVRSAHTTFVLTQLLGFTNVKNYDGSWIEWSYHSELPIETDEVITIEKTKSNNCSKDDNSACQTKFFILVGSIFGIVLIVFLFNNRRKKNK